MNLHSGIEFLNDSSTWDTLLLPLVTRLVCASLSHKEACRAHLSAARATAPWLSSHARFCKLMVVVAVAALIDDSDFKPTLKTVAHFKGRYPKYEASKISQVFVVPMCAHPCILCCCYRCALPSRHDETVQIPIGFHS